jgi:hypothetical protein
MTTRRLNWTGRQRIGRERVAIAIEKVGHRARFTADIVLAGLSLPAAARVVVEAYRQTDWMRFDFGTAELIAGPEETWLTEFNPPDGVLFRVKVLGVEAEDGRILAEADQIRAVDPVDELTGREALLPTRGAPLGEKVWELVIDDGAQPPELLVNNLLADWRGVARSPHFLWMVYPDLLRQILTEVLRGDIPDPEDTQNWRSRWLRFGTLLPGVPAPPEEDAPGTERSHWIESAVQAFCRTNRFRERFLSIITDAHE